MRITIDILPAATGDVYLDDIHIMRQVYCRYSERGQRFKVLVIYEQSLYAAPDLEQVRNAYGQDILHTLSQAQRSEIIAQL